LILRNLGIHGITTTIADVGVTDEAQTEWAASVLVASELGNGCFSILRGIELDNTSASRTAVWLVLNLSLLDRANGCEQVD
jgi:hypothetical protein